MNIINVRHPFSAFLLLIILSVFHSTALAKIKGIYINQATAENKTTLTHLINESKSVGINTFVIDLERTNVAYKNNIQLVKNSGIKYVARIVIFPGGAKGAEIKSKAVWEKRYQLVEAAIGLGAHEIQLDYIRYDHHRSASDQNAKDVHAVIQWFKHKVDAHGIPLQIDVFGIASFGPSKHIGQDLKLFAPSVNAMNPMLYPSHFEPYKVHATQPYNTIYNALMAIRKQFQGNPPFKLVPYLELFNYRYPLNPSQRIEYIKAQIRAAEDAKTDGWYFWSASNVYKNLFAVLKAKQAIKLPQ